MRAGQSWEEASFDYIFRFSAREVTNEVVLIQADKATFNNKSQNRAQLALILERLAKDGCPLVVLDVLFEDASTVEADLRLAEAMRQLKVVVLAREMQIDSESTSLGDVVKLSPIFEPFLTAAQNWGVAGGKNEPHLIHRQHWPDANPNPRYPSLPWKAAQLAGTQLSDPPVGAWLRYYGEQGEWEKISYDEALRSGPDYFKSKTVFIGIQPTFKAASIPEEDKFSTPYSRWTHDAVGGVEINITQFLNLMNGDWLRRPGPWTEGALLFSVGIVLAAGLSRFRPIVACLCAGAIMLGVVLAGATWSFVTNYWFPYLIVCGAQVPCALAWTLMTPILWAPKQWPRSADDVGTVVSPIPPQETEDYERFGPPFGEGAFGKVWLVRDATGTWLALKEIWNTRLESDAVKFEMERQGITNYKPVSHQHPGLLRIEFVSATKRAGHFFYVMELGDSLVPGWEKNPTIYKPRDLKTVCVQSAGYRLPLAECLSIGAKLADALEFLHDKGLTHRDLKPSNIIFVNGQPKLADAGTVTVLRPASEIKTMVGSYGYMPPPPEPPGTRQADLYSLGMILYVISSGRDPVRDFPDVSTNWVEDDHRQLLRHIVCKACHPDLSSRYATATELKVDLEDALAAVKG